MIVYNLYIRYLVCNKNENAMRGKQRLKRSGCRRMRDTRKIDIQEENCGMRNFVQKHETHYQKRVKGKIKYLSTFGESAEKSISLKHRRNCRHVTFCKRKEKK